MYSTVLVVSLWSVSFATLLSLGGHILVDILSLSNKWCRVAGGHGGSWVTLVFSHCSVWRCRCPVYLSLYGVAGAQSIYDFLGTLSLRCNGVPTASQTAAVEIKGSVSSSLR
jgi:hypothetical protein